MSELVWPSVGWLKHADQCDQPFSCEHSVGFPEWWLLMARRGIPYHPDRDRNLLLAEAKIRKYRGHPPLSEAGATFVREAMLDGLVAAPQPVTRGWVSYGLSCMSELVRWAENNGQPLDRGRLLDEETRERFIHVGCHDKTRGTRSGYRSRLDVIASVLLAQPRLSPRVPIPKHAPQRPLSHEDESDQWSWAKGLRTESRRQRLKATLALGLGCGVSRAEQVVVLAEDVLDHGAAGVEVLVTDRGTGEVRNVACRAVWEERLRELARETPPGRPVLTPWRDTPSTGKANDQALMQSQRAQPPPVTFNTLTLRTTWLCRHLEAGTPLAVLMNAADVASAERLVQLIAYTRPFTEDERRRFLRDAL